MRSWKWAFTQDDWRPYERGKLDRQVQQEDYVKTQGEDGPFVTGGDRPQEKPTLRTS